MKTYMTISIALMLTACATSSPVRYMKNSAGEEEFSDVAYQCKEKTMRALRGAVKSSYGDVSSQVDVVDCAKFNACMASKGFIKSPNGRFVVRNDKEIDCKE